ncbi:MAG: GNAT family protein [Hyphomicrobiaceae bacterium]
MDAQIRQICEPDILGYHACLAGVARERRYLAFLEPPPLEQTRAFVIGNITRQSPHLVAVTRDGDVVGWCDATPSVRHVSAHVGVLGMGLAPRWRGQGLGARLLGAALEAGWSYGLERIELGVFSHNERAAALYRKLGFELEGVKRRHVLIDGVFHDEIVMAILRS